MKSQASQSQTVTPESLTQRKKEEWDSCAELFTLLPGKVRSYRELFCFLLTLPVAFHRNSKLIYSLASHRLVSVTDLISVPYVSRRSSE